MCGQLLSVTTARVNGLVMITDQSVGYDQALLIQTHLNNFLPGGICSLYCRWLGSPRAICKSGNLTTTFSFGTPRWPLKYLAFSPALLECD